MKKLSVRKMKVGGFTIVELLVVLMIIAILAILGIPVARGMIIGGKVEPTASDISKVVSKIRSNFSGQGATPYGAIDTSVFANTARTMASSLNVTGAGATAAVTHELGATGALITVAPGLITTANDSFDVTVASVDDAGCAVGAQMGRAAEIVTLNATVVKANGTSAYQGATAQTACTVGETNTFVFTFR